MPELEPLFSSQIQFHSFFYFIPSITTTGLYSMKVSLWDSNDNFRQANYETFEVGAGPQYPLGVSGFSSPEGYKLYNAFEYHGHGMDFSTRENNKDFDDDNTQHCAKERQSAGW